MAAAGRKHPKLKDALALLEAEADDTILEEMGPRYGIWVKKAWGVRVGTINRIAKELGPDQALAEALWDSGWYEARLLASMVGEADTLTPAAMDRWRKDFDNWGVVDTVCFKLFDRAPDALAMVPRWVKLKDEWGRRAGFVQLACVALHRKDYPDSAYIELLPLCEAHATDDRNFVAKGLIWALKALGQKPLPRVKAETLKLAKRLAESDDRRARATGKEVVRDLSKKS